MNKQKHKIFNISSLYSDHQLLINLSLCQSVLKILPFLCFLFFFADGKPRVSSAPTDHEKNMELDNGKYNSFHTHLYDLKSMFIT